MKNDWNWVDMSKDEFNAEFDEYPEARFTLNIKPEPKIKKNSMEQIENMINRLLDKVEAEEKGIKL